LAGLVALGALCLAACADEVDGIETAPAPEPLEAARQGLVVGGCQCPSWQPGVSCGELSYADIPADDTYYITTFGGPGEGQNMWICGYKSTDNGSWAYMAGHERFGCGKVLIKHPSLDKYCVAEVADCGPNKCVEEAACFCGCGGHEPILDVSPFITSHLFGITASGWSEKREVIAWQVDATEPIGCFNGGVEPDSGTLMGVVYEAPDPADRIPGATVTLNTGQTATANDVGYWEFELAPGTYTATATKAGYLSASQTRSVAAGAEIWGSIGLSPCVCDDGNPCTDDACLPATGCVFTPNASTCDDGDLCTAADHCVGGFCVGGQDLVCDDDDPCTDDACAGDSGCTHVENSAPCDDGDACTGGDLCADGVCAGQDISAACDDGDPCTVDSCQSGLGCVHHAAPGACDDGNPCTEDSCAVGVGCVHGPRDGPCDDGDACTWNDHCVAGACGGGPSKICSDGNPCTDDLCDAGTGACVFPPNLEACDDGDPCTVGDGCEDGDCVGVLLPGCGVVDVVETDVDVDDVGSGAPESQDGESGPETPPTGDGESGPETLPTGDGESGPETSPTGGGCGVTPAGELPPLVMFLLLAATLRSVRRRTRLM